MVVKKQAVIGWPISGTLGIFSLAKNPSGISNGMGSAVVDSPANNSGLACLIVATRLLKKVKPWVLLSLPQGEPWVLPPLG